MEWKVSLLEPGDHIRVKRSSYYHHGVYIGNGEVIHYTAINDDGIVNPKDVLVRKTDIAFFNKEGVAERAIYTRKELKNRYKVPEIIKRATDSIGKGDYNFISNNCEDFANYCCYKKPLNNTQIQEIREKVRKLMGNV